MNDCVLPLYFLADCGWLNTLSISLHVGIHTHVHVTTTHLAGRVERLDADAVGADVDDAAHLEAVDIVRHPHSLPAVHARSSTHTRARGVYDVTVTSRHVTSRRYTVALVVYVCL